MPFHCYRDARFHPGCGSFAPPHQQLQELICEFAKCFEILQDEECHKMEVIIPLAKKLFIFFLCKALEFLQTFLWQKLIRARWGIHTISWLYHCAKELIKYRAI